MTVEKTYTHDAQRYFVNTTFTGIFSAFIAVAALVLATPAFGQPVGLMVLVAAVGVYTVFNTFVSHAYPSQVTLADDHVSFTSYGRTDTYAFDQIEQFSVREFPGAWRSYVRINGGSLTRGRYWVRGMYFTDGEELYHALSDLDVRLNPGGLKAHARQADSYEPGATDRTK